MDKTFSKNEETRNADIISLGHSEGKRPLQDLGVIGRIIIK
jgi:hypothetical protein